jgi:hypothetical protein
MENTSITSSFQKRKILYKTGNLFLKIGKWLIEPSTLIEIICAFLIILFVYTGINKIMDYEKFKFEMGRSPFIQNISKVIAITLPPGELLVALLLIINKTKLTGLYISFFLMSLFTGYIWLMLNYAYDLPCSCGGILAKMSWEDHLCFNAGFTILAAVAIILQSRKNTQKTI